MNFGFSRNRPYTLSDEQNSLCTAIANTGKKNKEALDKIENKTSMEEYCSFCAEKGQNSKIIVVNNKQVYGRSVGKWSWIYICRGCRQYVGMHPYTTVPLGLRADFKTRQQRIISKGKFNDLWYLRRQKHEISVRMRTMYYKLLAEEMNLKKEDCHFGMFDYEQCIEAEKCIIRIRENLKNE